MATADWDTRDHLVPEFVIDSLQMILREIGRYRRLTLAEQIELARRYERGDLMAKERLVDSHLRFVVYMAKPYRDKGLPFLDLIQEGTIGMNRAIERYDWRRGYALSTFAASYIRDALQRAIADQVRTIRLPRKLIEKQQLVARADRILTAALGRSPSIAELAEVLATSEADIVNVLLATQPMSSLDAPLTDGDATVGDLIEGTSAGSDARLAQEMAHHALDRALGRLPPRERLIIELHYGLDDRGPLNLAEIGRELGLTRERVRQLEGEAFRSLRESPEADAFREGITD